MGSLWTVSSWCGGRTYPVMSQQESCEEECSVRSCVCSWGCFLGTFSKACVIAVRKAQICSELKLTWI